MASRQSKELAAKVLTSAMSAGGAKMGQGNSSWSGPGGAFAQILATQIDVGAELVMKGTKITKGQLSIALAQKLVSLSNAAVTSEAIQCGGSLAAIGLALAATAASIPTGPMGWAATVLGLLSEIYSANTNCEKPYKDLSAKAKNETLSVATRFRSEFWSWVSSNGGMAPPN